tara:strand:- start:603 stop:1370 length:768 start_codon:yes stop_codon:yes gene_type:complete
MIEFFAKFPILKRLIPSIGIRLLKILKKSRGYYKIKNIYLYLDFLDPIDRQIIIYKEYENDQIKFVENQMLKNQFEYFLDIGANSGYYSFYFASKFKNLKIKSIEPNLDAFNKFKNTLNKNKFENIEIFNFALSDREDKTKMVSMISHNYIHSNSTINDNINKENNKINTFETSLRVGDKLFNFSNKKLFFKIDVEGHESYVLQGLIKNLTQNKCLILIEISDAKFNEVNKFLIKNNFKKIFKSDLRNDYAYTNL